MPSYPHISLLGYLCFLFVLSHMSINTYDNAPKRPVLKHQGENKEMLVETSQCPQTHQRQRGQHYASDRQVLGARVARMSRVQPLPQSSDSSGYFHETGISRNYDTTIFSTTHANTYTVYKPEPALLNPSAMGPTTIICHNIFPVLKKQPRPRQAESIPKASCPRRHPSNKHEPQQPGTVSQV